MIITNSKAKKKGAQNEHLNYHLLSILIVVYHDLFSDAEKEYMEALDDVIEDGAIPNNVRRLLERERKSLGISEERAKELEEIKCKA